jgi:RNA polymerase sigma-70 factor (ECF subfamily)
MKSDHRSLVLEASRGDARAADSLFERHMPGLLAFVRARAGARLREREDTLDLVQSACREVLNDLPSHGYRDEAMFKHWLFLAAERKILDKARYHGREKRANAGRHTLSAVEADLLGRGYVAFDTPSRAAIAREELALLEDAMQRLTDEHREVILFSRIIGLSHAEIAEMTGKSEVAVRSLLHRALARLTIEMGGPSGTT